MGEVKDKMITVESLKALHDYNQATYLEKIGANKLLWSDIEHTEQMGSEAAVYFSELISEQSHGVVFVFSRYADDEVKDYDFCSFFVPKHQVINHNHCGMNFVMSDFTGDIMAKKYLYVHDTGITGYENNDTTINGSCGITWTNNGFVLRYVIGV